MDIRIANAPDRKSADPLIRALERALNNDKLVKVHDADDGTIHIVASVDDLDAIPKILQALSSIVLAMTSESSLRALSEGCDRLHYGDTNDRDVEDAVDLMMIRTFGLLRNSLSYFDAQDAVDGFVAGGHYVLQNLDGWHLLDDTPVPSGTSIYFDPSCTILLKVT